MSNIVILEDFFDFNSNDPINRIAYTKEDMDYKIKIIKKMQELGMNITIDKIGNICGSISIGNNPKKTLAIGSHTDSVYDGGQFDGPVGVMVGLQTVEELLKSQKCTGTINVAIYACEESSRFGNACIGSKYLNGDITEKDFDKIVDQSDKITTLRDAILSATEYLKQNVEGIQEVNKIFNKVDYSLEAHIEQYESLTSKFKNQESIGIITSIGSAVRIKYKAKGFSGHTGSTPMKERQNAVDAVSKIGNKVRKLGKEYERYNFGRASQVEINTIGHNGSFNQIPHEAEGLIDFRLLGQNTPERVLDDFNKIIKKVEKKTKTTIEPTIVSQGTPVITDPSLNSDIATICTQNGIQHMDMPSWAGQDTGYIPANAKTMIFIPSTGGSHNPSESTGKRFIGTATRVFADLSKSLLLQKFRDEQVVPGYRHPVSQSDDFQTSDVIINDPDHTLQTR